ncbi:MAG: octaprenyl diphosphate synthase [Gammaproteobacteria bacterium]|nr:octaprenyl diphosphate synthase [Gammaproteobacteria bacterium]NIR85857.1 octaprenyl diphosphate synthase [Gammaproteobacteria bacterium]NIR90613.1 octaprenyl diphosphate synthase [Gammaproteobacteria bacterium]NIU06992.1 octaprenyl diphosphate synthase [Gammaproteobacteria bacterium]NIV75905.1 octaprenyl diphosphate synthase [Gammaproteobacteria bacterium]
MDLETIHALVETDMRAVDRLIERRLASNVILINHVAHYIINSGGKRLRPLVLLLGARAFGFEGQARIDLAAVIEFIHTATLLHDDVVDGSHLRRGKESANAVWGPQASVLVGDFLYSRSFQMMVDVHSMRVMEILADTTNVVAEGEVLQLLNCHEPDTSEEQYLRVIRCKTAKLFEAASRLGPVLGEAGPPQEAAMASYGLHLGTAYQLVDDVLDYQGSSEEIGKNVGDDLAEGKPTLPLIHAMRTGGEAQAAVIRHAIENGGRENIREVVDAVESTEAIAYTARAARVEADLALEAIREVPSTPYREALGGLVEFSVSRSY